MRVWHLALFQPISQEREGTNEEFFLTSVFHTLDWDSTPIQLCSSQLLNISTAKEAGWFRFLDLCTTFHCSFHPSLYDPSVLGRDSLSRGLFCQSHELKVSPRVDLDSVDWYPPQLIGRSSYFGCTVLRSRRIPFVARDWSSLLVLLLHHASSSLINNFSSSGRH